MKVIDSMSAKPKAFEDIKHNHDVNPSKLQRVECQRCHYDIAEQSLKDKIKSIKDGDKTKFPNLNGVITTYTFKELVVHRGRYDDCISWDILWQ